MICRVTSHTISSRPPQAPTSPSTGLLLKSRHIIFKYWKWWFDCFCQVSGHFHPCDQIQKTLLCSQLIWLYPLSWTNSRHFSILSLFGGILFSGALSSLGFCHSFLSPDFPYLSGSFLFLYCCLCLLSVSHVTITQGSVLFSLSSCLPPFLPFLNMLTPGGLIIPNV